MSLPTGYKYLNNMALYLLVSLKQAYIEEYGDKFLGCYDQVDKTIYKEKIFCLDCLDFERCKGKKWDDCKYKKEALRIIREEE